MQEIDFNKSLTFTSLLKFMVPAWALILIPYYAFVGILAYNGIIAYEINDQAQKGVVILTNTLRNSLVQPAMFALACSLASTICQPFAFKKGRLPLLGVIFLLKNMTVLGFWIWCRFTSPHVGYDD